MTGCQILVVVLVVLFLLGQIKVGVAAEYGQEGLTVRARIAALKIKVFPLPKKEGKKPKKKKPKKKRKKKGAPAPKTSTVSQSGETSAVADSEPTGKKGKEKPEKTMTEKIGGALDLAQQFVPLALEAAGCFWKRLVMDRLELCLTVGSPDPADAALLYGQANAALAALWEPLNRAFHVKDGYARVRVDFDSSEMALCANASLSLKIGQILWLALYFGVRALIRFLRYRSIRKAKQKQRKAV